MIGVRTVFQSSQEKRFLLELALSHRSPLMHRVLGFLLDAFRASSVNLLETYIVAFEEDNMKPPGNGFIDPLQELVLEALVG